MLFWGLFLCNRLSSLLTWQSAAAQLSILFLEKTFNRLINSFIDNNVGIAEDFLSVSLAAHLKDNLTSLYARQQLRAAGIGNDVQAMQNREIRRDVIYWLDRAHEDVYEDAFFDLMDLFVRHLNETCYTGITGYEFHYAMYEEGSFYKKHLDQFRCDDSRQFSMIIYLNAGWVEADGGELCVHHANRLQFIAPENRKGVFFRSSELEHEVLKTNKARMSVTGWLKRG